MEKEKAKIDKEEKKTSVNDINAYIGISEYEVEIDGLFYNGFNIVRPYVPLKPKELQQRWQQILEEFGCEPLEAVGFQVCVWIQETQAEGKLKYADSDGKLIESSLIAPTTVTAEDKWAKIAGKVVSMGPEAYKTGVFADGIRKPRCRLGDIVMIPRHEGTLINFAGKPIMVLPDDKIIAKPVAAELVSRY